MMIGELVELCCWPPRYKNVPCACATASRKARGVEEAINFATSSTNTEEEQSVEDSMLPTRARRLTRATIVFTSCNDVRAMMRTPQKQIETCFALDEARSSYILRDSRVVIRAVAARGGE